jgi:hypothetical protein
MKRPILELRSRLQGHGINPHGFELVLVAPDEARRKAAHDALVQDLSIEEAARFADSGTVQGTVLAIETND